MNMAKQKLTDEQKRLDTDLWINGDHAAGNAQGPRRCGNGLADDTASEAGNALYPVFAEMGNRGSRYLR